LGRVILDSSVLIASLKQSDQFHQSATHALSEVQNEYFISSITLAEAMMGYMKSERYENIAEHIKSVLTIIEVNSEVAIEGARLRAQKGLKLPDALIAATAQLHRLDLWTFDAPLSKAAPGARLLK
jgi:predicted nucleic acid-binding protein